MKKIIYTTLVLGSLIFVACDSEIDADATSVSDYEFISFEDDILNFELNQSGTSVRTITVYNSRKSSSDVTIFTFI